MHAGDRIAWTDEEGNSNGFIFLAAKTRCKICVLLGEILIFLKGNFPQIQFY